MQIIPVELYKFLSLNGFKYHTLENTSDYRPIEVEEKFMILRKMEDIKKFTIDSIRDAQEDLEITEEAKGLILNALVTKKELFHDDNLLFLEEYNPPVVKDTKDISRVYFKNKYCEITKNNVMVKSYSEFEGAIYKSQVIDFLIDDTILFSDFKDSNFYDFIGNIASKRDFHDEEEIASLKSIIGYLLHTYKDPTLTKAVILMDEDNGLIPNGGTGKTLLIRAIEKIRNVKWKDGKDFSFNKRFSMSGVDWDTQILAMDDVPKSFDFERFFPAITSGITVEEKFEKAFRIPPELSPKIIITTNYTVSGEGQSHRRRRIEFELSDYFIADWGPDKVYGRRFFDDWNEQDWKQFYLFMMTCIQTYLRKGLIDPPAIDINLKNLLQEAGEEFISFMDDNVILNQRYDKKELFEKYIMKYPGQKGIVQRTFTSWIKLYSEFKEYKITESHSDDIGYFILIKDND
jgi:hypothetical protein